MKDKVKVKFWISGHVLFVQNEETEEIKIIENQKQIAWFLNAHYLIAPEINYRYIPQKMYPFLSQIHSITIPPSRWNND